VVEGFDRRGLTLKWEKVFEKAGLSPTVCTTKGGKNLKHSQVAGSVKRLNLERPGILK
jgi:hypothetical protein